MPTFEQIMGQELSPEQQQKVVSEMERLKLTAESVVPFSVQESLGEIKAPVLVSGGEVFKPPQVDIKSPTPDVLLATTGIDAKLNALLADIEIKQKQYETEKTAAETEQKGIMGKVGEFFAGRKPQEQILSGLEARYQIPETLTLQKTNLETMKSLRESIIGLQTEQMKAQATLESRAGVPRGIMGAQTQELERQYTIRQAPLSAQLSALGAYDEALRGNITQATQLMRNYVEAANYEDAMRLKEYEITLDNNRTIIANLDKGLQSALDDRKVILQTQATNKRQELEQIAKLVTDNPQVNWSGFDFARGTLQDALNVAATSPARGKILSVSEAQALGVSYGTTQAEAIQMGIIPARGIGIGEALVSAIMQNPQLFYTLSSTARTNIIPQLQKAGFDVSQLVSPTFVGKAKDAVAAFQSSSAMLDTIEQQAAKVLQARGTLGAWWQLGTKKLGAWLKTDPDAMVYSSTIGTFRSLLTRAAGEKGVLTQKDVENIQKALPQFGDPKDVWRQKLQNLRDLYASIESGAKEAYLSPEQVGEGSTFTSPSGNKYQLPY